jgi:stearoyl-CoA desaturase (delta-9 desaturase)
VLQAKFPLRLFLVVANSMAGQNSIYTWSRDHRLHHKCSETHGDPHNANRGFFFAHMGWLMVRKHPAVMKAGKTINMTDLEQDSLVMFQHRHYIPCFLLAGFVLPTLLPHLLWGEDLTTAYFMAVTRYVGVLHFTWLVNSAAHIFGNKPYDKTIGPSENRLVSILAMGEGFHNYHHTFPYDYSTSEWGFRLNVTTLFIDTMASLGLAYDLRSANPATVTARAIRTGDPGLTRRGAGAKDS